MPRLPVDGTKVVEHRVTLGGKERELLESAMTAYSFRNISQPVINLISDNSALAFIGVMIAIFLPDWLPDDWEEVTEDMTARQVKDWLEPQNLLAARGAAAIFSPFGLVATILAAITASIGVEMGEDVVEDLTSGSPIGVTAGLIVLSNQLRKLGLPV